MEKTKCLKPPTSWLFALGLNQGWSWLLLWWKGWAPDICCGWNFWFCEVKWVHPPNFIYFR
jgi:hypothetical protein